MTTLQTADGKLLHAQRPAGLVMGGGFGVFPPMWSSGERAGDDDLNLRGYAALYRSQPNLAAVVDKLSRRIATLPFDAYERLDEDQRKMLPRSDSLASLLAAPMPRSSKVHLLAHIAQSLLIHGNGLVATLRGPDREAPPSMLWPLDWGRVNAYGPDGGRIEWWSTTQFDGVERFINANDVLLFAWPNPEGGEIGVSPLEKLGVTIRLEDAAQRHQTGMFKNGVRPSLAVSVEGDMSVEKLEFARARTEAMHKGVDNSGSTFFMGSNVKLQPLSMSPVEVALIEQRNLNLGEIGRVYDLSGPVMNDLEHGTYSNVQVLLDALYRDVVPVWLELISSTFQRQLLDTQPAWLNKFVSFDLTDKLKGDPVQLSESLKVQVEAGLLTRNEARRILNLPPMNDEAADQLTMNVNNQAPISTPADTGTPSPSLA